MHLTKSNHCFHNPFTESLVALISMEMVFYYLLQRVKNMVKPCDVWVLEAKETSSTCTKRMFIDRIKFNLTGTKNVEPCELELNCLEDVKS